MSDRMFDKYMHKLFFYLATIIAIIGCYKVISDILLNDKPEWFDFKSSIGYFVLMCLFSYVSNYYRKE